eukprot:m.98695 g.98695  ORF g.98695 m.98695 type:complete len:479 (-) comp15561_c0_seq1:53-1489(-)
MHVREGRQAHRAHGVAGEVEEGRGKGDERPVGVEAVADGRHGMLADAEAHVVALRMLLGEVDVVGLDLGQRRGREVGRAAKELGHDGNELLQHHLRVLAGGLVVLVGLERGQGCLPVLRQTVSRAPLKLRGQVGVRGLVAAKELVPGGSLLLADGLVLGKVGCHVGRDGKELIRLEAELGLDLLEVLVAERRAVHLLRALSRGAAADGGLDRDERGLVVLLLGALDRRADGREVGVAVLDAVRVPAVGLVALQHVLGEGQRRLTVNLDLVVVVEDNQLAEAKVTSERRSLARHALLHAAIAADDVGVVVDQLEVRLVEASSHVGLGDSETNGVGQTLAERARGDLDTLGEVVLRVAGRLAADLAEVLQVLDGEVVAREVQHDVLQGAAVAVGEDEAVAANPVRVLGRVVHELAPEDVGHGGAAHGSTRVAGLGFLHRIRGQDADGVDTLCVKGRILGDLQALGHGFVASPFSHTALGL